MSTMTMGVASEHQSLLRRMLFADGAICGISGSLLTLAAGPLADPLGLPDLFLRLVGISLLPVAAGILYLATRASISRRLVWGVIGLNLCWSIASVLLLFTGWGNPTTAGVVFIVAQALIVAAVSDLEYLGLRRAND